MGWGWWRAKRRTGTGTPRAVEQRKKEEPGGRGIIRIGGMQGNGRERNRKAPPPLSHHLSTFPHPPQARELCTLQGAGPGVALLPKEPSASFSPPTSALAVCSRTHPHPPLPSHVWLARKEGAAPYAQVRRILQKTLLKVRVDVVVAPRVPRQVSVRSLRPTGLQ